ncbi:transforming growth factor beta-1-induced transcript 1 protein isoform X3 [Pectinophora gossypiella]|uniref:transforming growth factor beta-1-induced transcript 1 protein isoform X3 n=1 Tax=Pectinophora gossypiella TaxID=13191 RepID=UPI00214EDC69|nr:transforming growth factor beta-1-induced transcript 1 protein isoform X3 [Pectinophora gossypiella]
MGLAISAIISYAGIHEAIEFINHILNGMVPDTDPDFTELVEYYTKLLQKSANPSSTVDWTRQCGQGYLCLTEDENGKLKSAAVKYYDGQPDSTAILFSTKISSFGQDSVDSNSSHANGDYRTERYTPTKTKTIISNSSESFSVGQRNRSPTSENISDHRFSEGSFGRDEGDEQSEGSNKLTWLYRPKSPSTHQPTLPEIHFQSFDDDARGVKVYSEEFLRSRSRENSNERRPDSWDIAAPEDVVELKPKLKDMPKLGSFEEEKEDAKEKLIFSGEYTKAMNKDWHSGHFCCWQCDESLTGQRYVLRDEHPYCIKCYESVFANGCEECNKIIGIDSKDLSYKDKHWHEACFLCAKCRVSLVDKQFGSKLDKIYCGNCYDAQFASRCDGCGEVFRAGTKKMEYKTRQWHEKCFCCVVCKNPIGTKSFIPREQEIYCAGCYEDKFATRCVKCNKIITQGGVTYKNEPWHRECFTCTNCNTSLAGQRFTSRDEKPYCADCFGELFAKRCTSCTKPITGIGGTRFISFEDRHWHNDCFICAQCKTSLVGKGFITDGQDIICPECAKQKLM